MQDLIQRDELLLSIKSRLKEGFSRHDSKRFDETIKRDVAHWARVHGKSAPELVKIFGISHSSAQRWLSNNAESFRVVEVVDVAVQSQEMVKIKVGSKAELSLPISLVSQDLLRKLAQL